LISDADDLVLVMVALVSRFPDPDTKAPGCMDALDKISPPLAPGMRVVVRSRLPDASATDVVGWVESVDRASVVLTDHNGRTVPVERRTILAARRAPAARGGRDPHRTSPEELEQIALPGWVAGREPLGEWSLRAAGGFTGRANSCLAVGDPGMALPDAAQRVLTFAAAHGIEPRAQVLSGSDNERGLRDLGWRETYVRTDVLVARLADLLGDSLPDPRIALAQEPDAPWWRAYGLSRPTSAPQDVLRQVLVGGPACRLAGVRDGKQVIAIGRGHVSADWLGLSSLWTAPEHRRRGWAQLTITALGHWAARSGARNVYLQVAEENEPAHRAYGSLGFSLHHRYLYLGPPTP
jgi:GNAT superfamily N-acetyltransferase